MAVSVVIPTYNREHLVLRAAQSALAACGPDDEVIVVDDGSTDQTETALNPIRERIQYVRIENAGAGHARNVGIERSCKPLIAFLDSDDVWLPFKLQLQRTVLARHPELVFCCSNFSVRTDQGEFPSYLQRWWDRDIDLKAIFGEGVPFNDPLIADVPLGCNLHIADFYKSLIYDGIVCLITLLYRKDRAPHVRFPEDLPTYEDWEFSGRLAGCGLGAYLDCDTAINYGHEGPRLTDANTLVCAQTRLQVMQRLWRNDPQFMAEHQCAYALVESQQNSRAADWLIRHGRNREARRYLTGVTNATFATRALASLPVPRTAIELLRKAVTALRQRM